MAERVRDFLRAHKVDGVGEGLGLAKLEELLARAEVLATQQRVGVAEERSATKHRKEVRGALQPRILGYLRAVAAVAIKRNPSLAEQFRMPPFNATHQALLTTGRAVLEKATAQKELLVALGMSEQVLDELAQALGAYEQTLESTRAGRREHVGARADLESVALEIGEQIRLLDGVVRYRFGNNAELMGAWASARNVAAPLRSKSEPDAGGGSQTPKAA
jgi:hypothetical protein